MQSNVVKVNKRERQKTQVQLKLNKMKNNNRSLKSKPQNEESKKHGSDHVFCVSAGKQASECNTTFKGVVFFSVKAGWNGLASRTVGSVAY